MCHTQTGLNARVKSRGAGCRCKGFAAAPPVATPHSCALHTPRRSRLVAVAVVGRPLAAGAAGPAGAARVEAHARPSHGHARHHHLHTRGAGRNYDPRPKEEMPCDAGSSSEQQAIPSCAPAYAPTYAQPAEPAHSPASSWACRGRRAHQGTSSSARGRGVVAAAQCGSGLKWTVSCKISQSGNAAACAEGHACSRPRPPPTCGGMPGCMGMGCMPGPSGRTMNMGWPVGDIITGTMPADRVWKDGRRRAST